MDPVKRDIGVRGSPAGTTQPSGRHRHQAERERLPEELKTLSSTSSCLLHAFEWALPVGEPLPAAPSRSLPSRFLRCWGGGLLTGSVSSAAPQTQLPQLAPPPSLWGPHPSPCREHYLPAHHSSAARPAPPGPLGHLGAVPQLPVWPRKSRAVSTLSPPVEALPHRGFSTVKG